MAATQLPNRTANGDLDVSLDRAREAQQRHDWIAAEGFWRVAIARDPNSADAHLGLAHALRRQERPEEAEAVLWSAAAWPSATIDCLIALTEIAERHRDPEETVRRWRDVRARFPDDPRGYLGNAEAARRAQLFDEVTTVLSDAVARLANDRHLHLKYAEWAEQRSDWAAAEVGWRAYLANDPGSTRGCLGLANALRMSGRAGEADAMLTRLCAANPTDLALRTGHARHAEGDANWPEALARWMAVIQEFPASAAGFEGTVRTRRALGRRRDAAEALAAGLRRFPNDAGLLIEAARLAHNAGLVEVALDAWADVRNRFPDAAPGWLEAAEILVRERRFDAAERLLVEALRAVPGDPAVYRACADLAEARGEPIQADLIRLDIASLTPNQGSPEARPRDATGWSGSGVPLAETGDPASLRDLALAFESLGGTGPSGGCEFGAVQNAWGADPLGLLRWAAVTPASLVAALTARFAGIEDVTPENLFLNPDDPRDLWWIREPRYDIVMHGFLPAHEASRERAAEVSRRRLRYLRDKLVRDLESPEKTFVFKLSTRHLTDEEIIRIDAALRAVGPAELLCVCAADPDHSAGALERRAPGLWVGYLDYSDQWANEPRRPGWRTLCEAVVRGRRPG